MKYKDISAMHKYNELYRYICMPDLFTCVIQINCIQYVQSGARISGNFLCKV